MNLKEQGRLLRQDNFTVWTGKKKHQRRVFLQDDLVIFSKVRKQPGGVDLYYYKNSLKVTNQDCRISQQICSSLSFIFALL